MLYRSFICLAVLTAAPLQASSQAPYTLTERISTATGGVEATGASWRPSISEDGNLIAYWSEASDLVPGDTNGVADVFVYDRTTGLTERVSVGVGGTESNGASMTPSISADGRYVAFRSAATNLFFFLDTNGEDDVYLYDRQTQVTERISEDSFGFQVNGESKEPGVSEDGRYVSFTSTSSNLVVGDANGAPDVFRKDRQTGVVELVSMNLNGMAGNAQSGTATISPDGRFVGFESVATDLIVSDLNGFRDVFLRDMATGSTERVSESAPGVGPSGRSYVPVVARDGDYVAFQSIGSNIFPGNTNSTFDIFRWQRSNQETLPASTSTYGGLSDGASYLPTISADGMCVAFQSLATNLARGDTNGVYDIYMKDFSTGMTEVASTNVAGVTTDLASYQPALSGDGRYLFFSSEATNLVAGDTNGVSDIYSYDLLTGGATMSLSNVVANQTATVSVTGATPASSVIVGWSLFGMGPTPSPWGPISLSPPIYSLSIATDGAGVASLDFALPSALLGFTLSVQGVDLTTDYPTTAAWEEIVL